MQHLSDGALRQLIDEPLLLSVVERGHYAMCNSCRHRYTVIAADVNTVRTLLDVPGANPDPARALAAIRQRIAEQPVRQAGTGAHHPGRVPRSVLVPGRRFAGSLVFAAALIAGIALTPVGSLAQNLLTIFQPQQFVAVPVSMDDLKSLPDLQQYGTMTWPPTPATRSFISAAAAAAAAGGAVRVPATLPVGISRTVAYTVVPATTASFTFRAAKVRAAAAATGKSLPPMPPSLDGSTLQVHVGPVVIARYGAATHGQEALPDLIVVQAPAPRVTSTGASAETIERYLLSQPGISPQLVSEIKAIGDPSTTLPIPVPVNFASAEKVQVQGVAGLAIGDNTHVGSGVIWRKDGMVFGVAGAQPESQILATARSLR